MKAQYLAGCSDNTLPVGVTLQIFSEFAEQEDTHLDSIELLFAVRHGQRPRQEKRRQRNGKALDH